MKVLIALAAVAVVLQGVCANGGGGEGEGGQGGSGALPSRKCFGLFSISGIIPKWPFPKRSSPKTAVRRSIREFVGMEWF